LTDSLWNQLLSSSDGGLAYYIQLKCAFLANSQSGCILGSFRPGPVRLTESTYKPGSARSTGRPARTMSGSVCPSSRSQVEMLRANITRPVIVFFGFSYNNVNALTSTSSLQVATSDVKFHEIFWREIFHEIFREILLKYYARIALCISY